MSIQYINFDSLNGCTYNQTQNNNTYQFSTQYLSLAPNSYNANFQLSSPLYKVKKIYLKSLELPIAFNNVRSTNKSNIFCVSSAAISTSFDQIA